MFPLLAVVLASPALADFTSRAGQLTVATNDRGQFTLHFGKQTLVNYEALQLVDHTQGWRVVYSESTGGGPTETLTPTGVALEHHVRGILDVAKTLTVGDAGKVAWQVKLRALPNTGAQDCYYFLDLPAGLLQSGLVEVTAAGRTEQRLVAALSAGAGPLYRDLSRVTFTTQRATLQFDLAATNGSWLLTDWSQTAHKSYRLRVEQPVEEGFATTLEIAVCVTPTDPSALAAKKQALEKRRRLQAEQARKALGFVQDQPLRLGAVHPDGDTVPQWGKLELTVALTATYANPFDPAQIDLRAEVTAPSGKRLTVPGFFTVDYRREGQGRLAPGRPRWVIRFSPREVGRHEYVVVATDRSGTVRAPAQQFQCAPSDADGQVRVCRTNPRYFEHASGKPYLPVGVNLFVMSRLGSPPPADRLARCQKVLTDLADGGGNFARLRMDSWWLALEGPPDPRAGYLGPGWYQMQTAWEIDQLYALAERRGIQIMHCVDNANANVNDPREPWRRPYNFYLKPFGGPCETVDDFWTNPAAIALFRNRLRYAVARWGYSSSAFCWEFWNEYACKARNIDAATAWHRDMARFLRQLDPYDRPISTSIMGDPSLFDRIWSLPELDVNQKHTYVHSDQVAYQKDLLSEVAARRRKPFFLGETGLSPGHGEGRYAWDPQGLHFHNGLWAPVFSGAAGGGAFWYVEPFLGARNLYYHCRPLVDFIADIPWTSPDLRPAEVDVPTFAGPPPSRHYTDLALPTSMKYTFENKPPITTFAIPANGALEHADALRPHLYAGGARKAPPTFHVELDRPTEFRIGVGLSVGDDTNRLRVTVDGKLVVDRPFPAGKDLGVSSTYIAQYDNWKTVYDQTVTIPLTAGKHDLRPEAVGKDRLEVTYTLTDFLCFETADPVRAFGLATATGAWLWMQNRLSGWETLYNNRQQIPVPAGLTAELHGLRSGDYRVEWWDTWKGGVIQTDHVQCIDSRLTITLPALDRDLACRIVNRASHRTRIAT